VYEGTIEAKLFNKLNQWAVSEGIDMEVLKLNVKGRRGWPDRLITCEGGLAIFVEMKRPGEQPRALQSYVHQRLRKMGFTVKVYDEVELALEELKCLIKKKETDPFGNLALSSLKP
jgi:hypothetical protein